MTQKEKLEQEICDVCFKNYTEIEERTGCFYCSCGNPKEHATWSVKEDFKAGPGDPLVEALEETAVLATQQYAQTTLRLILLIYVGMLSGTIPKEIAKLVDADLYESLSSILLKRIAKHEKS